MIDWNKAPRWANWFATSERGIGCWFQNKPTQKTCKKYGMRWDSKGLKEYVAGIFFETTSVLVAREGVENEEEQSENHDISAKVE